jgi:hypothetical protein
MLLRQRHPALLGGHTMIKITTLPAIAAALLAFGLAAAPAQAGPNRTFVSGTGTDSGTCTRTAPCRTFAFALTQTAAGGEIDVLDPAGYGAVTINKSISINGHGDADINAGSGNGVTINAGASDSVHLRGLTIEGLGSGANGILFNTGGNLEIENCVARGFTNAGINISPTTTSSFSVSNTIASNNGIEGIFVKPTGVAAATGVLSNVTANNNPLGIFVDGGFTAGAVLSITIADSEASNNTLAGVELAGSPATPSSGLMLRNVVVSNNDTGLAAGTNAVLRVAHSVVTGNITGMAVEGAAIINSYGDNDIDGNTNNNTGVLTVIPTH